MQSSTPCQQQNQQDKAQPTLGAVYRIVDKDSTPATTKQTENNKPFSTNIVQHALPTTKSATENASYARSGHRDCGEG
jgi:hypothetical protein